MTFTAYITGYTYYDNTPARSALVSHPQKHKTAGGKGTYADPVTVAVGHVKKTPTSKSVLDFPAGTRFYLPYLDKYFIVEDTCGDGPKPQNGPCHRNPDGPQPWLDIWVNAKGAGATKASQCASAITGLHQAIRNPQNGLKVSTRSLCQ